MIKNSLPVSKPPHGVLIDPDYDPSRDDIYSFFKTYFYNPTMTKIKDIDIYSMYMTKIKCMLGGNMYRYLIAFIPKDGELIGKTEEMGDIRWITLQTRTLEDNHNLPPHSYPPRRYEPLYVPIKSVKNDLNYTCDSYPIIVTLIPTKKGTEYQPSGNIVTALETYNTVISWKE